MKTFSDEEKNDMDEFVAWMSKYTDRLDFKIMHVKDLIDDKFYKLLYNKDTYEVLYNILLQFNDVIDDNFKKELGQWKYLKEKKIKIMLLGQR